jgi:hypothetical protein
MARNKNTVPAEINEDILNETEKTVLNTVPAEINEELKATLEKYPHIDCVWMNEQGNWYFSDKPGFTAYSREEILNG